MGDHRVQRMKSLVESLLSSDFDVNLDPIELCPIKNRNLDRVINSEVKWYNLLYKCRLIGQLMEGPTQRIRAYLKEYEHEAYASDILTGVSKIEDSVAAAGKKADPKYVSKYIDDARVRYPIIIEMDKIGSTIFKNWDDVAVQCDSRAIDDITFYSRRFGKDNSTQEMYDEFADKLNKKYNKLLTAEVGQMEVTIIWK
jgi:hypothetical protein